MTHSPHTKRPRGLLLYCCFTAALLLLYCCFTAALLLLYCCFTDALLLLYCRFTDNDTLATHKETPEDCGAQKAVDKRKVLSLPLNFLALPVQKYKY